MRVALISDLHGNVPALSAVLADIDQRGVDRIVCLGDVATLGPQPNEVIAMLRDRRCACILGNHDDFLLQPELIRSYTEAPIIVDAVDWCRSMLSSDELAFVQTFIASLRIDLGGTDLFLFHGSPRSHMEDLLATTSASDLDRALLGQLAPIMAGGHTHLQLTRQHRGSLLVNPGSVGMPFKEYVGGGPPVLLHHAEYAIVEAGGVTLRRVPFDVRALVKAIDACTSPFAPALRAQYA